MSSDQIYDHRKNKFLKIGRGGGFTKSSVDKGTGLEFKEPFILKLRRNLLKNKYIFLALGLALIVSIIALLN